LQPEDSNGDTIVDTGSAVGETQTFLIAGASVTYVSDSFTPVDVSGSTPVPGTISLKFTVTAFGDQDVVISQSAANVNVDGYVNRGAVANDITGATDGAVIITSATDTATNGYFLVSAGNTKTFTLSKKFTNTTGFVQLAITSVDGTTVSNIHTDSH